MVQPLPLRVCSHQTPRGFNHRRLPVRDVQRLATAIAGAAVVGGGRSLARRVRLEANGAAERRRGRRGEFAPQQVRGAAHLLGPRVGRRVVEVHDQPRQPVERRTLAGIALGLARRCQKGGEFVAVCERRLGVVQAFSDQRRDVAAVEVGEASVAQHGPFSSPVSSKGFPTSSKVDAPPTAGSPVNSATSASEAVNNRCR